MQRSSGAHTIGRASCGSIQDRLFNYGGTGKPDPSLNAQYLNYLKRKCRWSLDYIDLDATTPRTLMLNIILIFQRRWDSYPQMKSCTLNQGLNLLSVHWLTNHLSFSTSLGCPWQSLGMCIASLVKKVKSEPIAILSTPNTNVFLLYMMIFLCFMT